MMEGVRVEIQVVQIRMVPEEGKPKLLTRSIAKQFPIARDYRAKAAERGKEIPPPLGKVWSETLGRDILGWLVLQPHPSAGFVWTAPAVFGDKYAASIVERGGWVDDLAAIPTIIL